MHHEDEHHEQLMCQLASGQEDDMVQLTLSQRTAIIIAVAATFIALILIVSLVL